MATLFTLQHTDMKMRGRGREVEVKPLFFVIFFNDFNEHVTFSKIVQYADDTVIYFAHIDVNKIERRLNEDMKTIGDYFQENKLIINVNKGKTEVMLFGSSKRLKRQGKSLQISYRDTPINTITQSKYPWYRCR